MIRLAALDDLDRITEIYNQAIESKRATADLLTFTPEQKKPWLLSHIENRRTPLHVFADKGTVVGFCYLSAYRPGRQALESIAEISYFVDLNHHRQGIASKLVQHALGMARKLEYKNLLAIVLSCNDSSVALLKKYGFVHWGTLPDIVYIDNNIYSHFYYGLGLRIG